MPGFESYMRRADVEAILKSKGVMWIQLEASQLPPNDIRPPFNIFTARVPEYNFEGVDGELRFDFFNDRLKSTWFFPKGVTTELGRLLVSVGDGNEKGEHNARFTRQSFHFDFRNRFYVGWEDTRLVEECNLWVAHFS